MIYVEIKYFPKIKEILKGLANFEPHNMAIPMVDIYGKNDFSDQDIKDILEASDISYFTENIDCKVNPQLSESDTEPKTGGEEYKGIFIDRKTGNFKILSGRFPDKKAMIRQYGVLGKDYIVRKVFERPVFDWIEKNAKSAIDAYLMFSTAFSKWNETGILSDYYRKLINDLPQLFRNVRDADVIPEPQTNKTKNPTTQKTKENESVITEDEKTDAHDYAINQATNDQNATQVYMNSQTSEEKTYTIVKTELYDALDLLVETNETTISYKTTPQNKYFNKKVMSELAQTFSSRKNIVKAKIYWKEERALDVDFNTKNKTQDSKIYYKDDFDNMSFKAYDPEGTTFVSPQSTHQYANLNHVLDMNNNRMPKYKNVVANPEQLSTFYGLWSFFNNEDQMIIESPKQLTDIAGYNEVSRNNYYKNVINAETLPIWLINSLFDEVCKNIDKKEYQDILYHYTNSISKAYNNIKTDTKYRSNDKTDDYRIIKIMGQFLDRFDNKLNPQSVENIDKFCEKYKDPKYKDSPIYNCQINDFQQLKFLMNNYKSFFDAWKNSNSLMYKKYYPIIPQSLFEDVRILLSFIFGINKYVQKIKQEIPDSEFAQFSPEELIEYLKNFYKREKQINEKYKEYDKQNTESAKQYEELIKSFKTTWSISLQVFREKDSSQGSDGANNGTNKELPSESDLDDSINNLISYIDSCIRDQLSAKSDIDTIKNGPKDQENQEHYVIDLEDSDEYINKNIEKLKNLKQLINNFYTEYNNFDKKVANIAATGNAYSTKIYNALKNIDNDVLLQLVQDTKSEYLFTWLEQFNILANKSTEDIKQNLEQIIQYCKEVLIAKQSQQNNIKIVGANLQEPENIQLLMKINPKFYNSISEITNNVSDNNDLNLVLQQVDNIVQESNILNHTINYINSVKIIKKLIANKPETPELANSLITYIQQYCNTKQINVDFKDVQPSIKDGIISKFNQCISYNLHLDNPYLALNSAISNKKKEYTEYRNDRGILESYNIYNYNDGNNNYLKDIENYVIQNKDIMESIKPFEEDDWQEQLEQILLEIKNLGSNINQNVFMEYGTPYLSLEDQSDTNSSNDIISDFDYKKYENIFEPVYNYNFNTGTSALQIPQDLLDDWFNFTKFSNAIKQKPGIRDIIIYALYRCNPEFKQAISEDIMLSDDNIRKDDNNNLIIGYGNKTTTVPASDLQTKNLIRNKILKEMLNSNDNKDLTNSLRYSLRQCFIAWLDSIKSDYDQIHESDKGIVSVDDVYRGHETTNSKYLKNFFTVSNIDTGGKGFSSDAVQKSLYTQDFVDYILDVFSTDPSKNVVVLDIFGSTYEREKALNMLYTQGYLPKSSATDHCSFIIYKNKIEQANNLLNENMTKNSMFFILDKCIIDNGRENDYYVKADVLDKKCYKFVDTMGNYADHIAKKLVNSLYFDSPEEKNKEYDRIKASFNPNTEEYKERMAALFNSNNDFLKNMESQAVVAKPEQLKGLLDHFMQDKFMKIFDTNGSKINKKSTTVKDIASQFDKTIRNSEAVQTEISDTLSNRDSEIAYVYERIWPILHRVIEKNSENKVESILKNKFLGN